MLSVRTIFAIVLGNALEWYDFIVYSFLTVYLAVLFFPNADPINSILAATATFGAAFVIRPIGGVVLGMYADRRGRKAAMTFIIALMSLAVAMLTFVPTYASIGVLAPLFVLLARLIQGFSAGGEYGTSTALLVELAPAGRKGRYGAFQTVGQMLSMLMAAGTCLLLSSVLTEQQILAWGWRVPFALGLMIAPIGIYIRRHLHETSTMASSTVILQARATLNTQTVRQILVAMGLIVSGAAATYIHFSHMPTSMLLYFHIPLMDAYAVLFLTTLETLIFIPYFGALSDRVGVKSVLFFALLAYLFMQYPLFLFLTQTPTFGVLLLTQCLVCLPLSALFGVTPNALAQLFPTATRSTNMSISYNLAVMLFGGFSPFIITWLVQKTGSPLAITAYLTGGFLLSVVALFFYREQGYSDGYAGMAIAPDRI